MLKFFAVLNFIQQPKFFRASKLSSSIRLPCLLSYFSNKGINKKVNKSINCILEPPKNKRE